MVLEDYRKQADPYLNPIASYFVHTHPNTMTWLAFVFAVLAGLTFVATNFLGQYSTAALFVAAALIFLNAIFDALDGKVARLSKRESKRGDFLDHVLDRYADLFIIGGMTISPFCDPWIGVLAIVGVIFASYMGTQAQAVGIRRDYGGLLGRSDRLVLLIFVPLIQMFLEMARLLPASHHFPVTAAGVTVNLSVIELMMVWFAIAGNATAIQRANSAWNELSKRESEQSARPDAEEKPAPGPMGVEDAEAQLEKGTLSLSEATAQLRSARLAVEHDMRDLKEKEIRLMKLEKRIARRQMEARRK
jgi:archaetidylinositol phosphate synthase